MVCYQWNGILLVLVIVQLAHQAPLDPKPADEKEEEKDTKINAEHQEEESMGLEYERYLREVIKVLESDPEMKAKMEEMSTDDLINGKFGKHVNFVGNHIRSQLDELKRTEIQRLRMVARKKMEESTGLEGQVDLRDLIAHVDFENEHTFEDVDLNNLLHKASKDLDEADKERRKEFKRYEIEKELKRRSQMKNMDQKQREAAEREYVAEKDKMKHHSKVNHPGSKKQLEEVWEKTDHLDRENFNPKTFFFLHDTNSDGFLDAFELEALFIKEVEKVYEGKNADAQEKFEELSRMREHVMTQIDKDSDQLVSLKEFMDAASTSDFEDDSEWKDLNQQDQFTEDDLTAYQRELQKTLDETKRKMAEAGDNFVRLRQPKREEPIAMDQAQAQQIRDDLTAGLPPLGDNKPDSNKLQFTGDDGPQPPAHQEAQPPAHQEAQPPAHQPPAQEEEELIHPPPQHQIPEHLMADEGNQIFIDPKQGGMPLQ